MMFKKSKRAIALGLAAAQFVPLTAVVMNVSAYAADTNTANTQKTPTVLKPQNIIKSVEITGATIDKKPVQAKLVGNTVEILKPVNSKLDNLTEAAEGKPAVPNNEVFVKLTTDKAKSLAFSTAAVKTDEKGASENIGDGYIGVRLTWGTNLQSVKFREYDDEVVAKDNEFWLKPKAADPTPDKPEDSDKTDNPDNTGNNTGNTDDLKKDDEKNDANNAGGETNNNGTPTADGGVSAQAENEAAPTLVKITNNKQFVTGQDAPAYTGEFTLNFKFVQQFTDTFYVKCTAPKNSGYSVQLRDANNRVVSRAKEGDKIKLFVTPDASHIAADDNTGWTSDTAAKSKSFYKEYTVSAADISDGNNNIDLSSKLDFKVQRQAQIKFDNRLRNGKVELLDSKGNLYNTNTYLKKGDTIQVKVKPNRGYKFEDNAVKVELTGIEDKKTVTYQTELGREGYYTITILDLEKLNLTGNNKLTLTCSGSAVRMGKDDNYVADLSVVRNSIKNASVTTDADRVKVAAGDEVVVTVAPNKGYVFKDAPTANGVTMQEIPNSDNYKVTLPATNNSENNRKTFNIKVEGEATLRDCYVTVENPSNGTITVKKGGSDFDTSQPLKMNDRLTILYTADKGYKFDKWIVSGGTVTGTTLKVDGTGDITIDAEFIDRYSSSSGGSGSSGSSNDYWYDDDDDYYDYSGSESVKVDGKTVSRYDMNNAIKTSTSTAVNVDLSDNTTSVTDGTRTTVYASTAKAVTDAVNNGGSNKSVAVKLSDDMTLTVDKDSVKSVDPSYSIYVTEQKTTVKPSVKTDNTAVRGTAAKSFSASNVGTVKADITVGSAKNGEFANVYRINSITRKSEFVGTNKVSGGKAQVSLNGDGQYVVMTGKYSDLKGDADNDGLTNVKDAVELLKQTARVKIAENNDVSITDVNGDGRVNVKDAVEILKQVAGVRR